MATALTLKLGSPSVRRRSKTSVAVGLLRWPVVVAAIVVAIFPLYWMIRTSVTPQSFMSGISPIPPSFSLSGYADAWTAGGMGRAVVNGAGISAVILVIQLITSVPAAFAFAKLRFKRRNALFLLIMAALLVPSQAITIPLFLGISYAGLSNTYAGLILPFTTTAFGLFLLRQYMLSIPDALIDAARMDGFSYLRILTRVVVPLSKPALVTFSLFSLFSSWNEYLWPLLVARSQNLWTPPLALATFQNAETGVDYAALSAGAVIVTLPIVVIFILARRNFVSGIVGTEIVG